MQPSHTTAYALLRKMAAERILVLDGAMGTMIQEMKLDEEGYRGARFDAWNREVRGNNDLLNLSRPDAIREIHLAYYRAGADIVSTNTFSSTSIAQADYGMSDIAYELNRDGARLAKEAAAQAEREDGRKRFVAGIKRNAPDVEVSVSAYPEKHPDSPTVDADIDMLEAKVDAGATRAITQFFFENDLYFRYLDRVRARGIAIPVVPGILPVQNFKQTRNFAERCGASVPRWLAERFDGLDEDVATRKLIAAAVAAEQVLDLVDRGVTDFHFYTMNRADLVYAVCHLLGLRPATRQAA